MATPTQGRQTALAHTLPETDWSLPLDVEAELRDLPQTGWIRGVFPDSLVKRLVAAGIDPAPFPTYHVLAKYPLHEYTRLIHFAARSLYPEVSEREAVRRLGQGIYPAFFDSMVGKAIFAVAGKNFKRAVEVAPKAYGEVGISPGSVRLARISEGYAYAELRKVWGLTQAYQVGVWEGALSTFGLTGSVRMKVLSACDIDLECLWPPQR